MNDKTKFLLLASLWLLLSALPARALDPNQPASSFLRTHFTTDEGLPGPVVGQIQQTKDGFLWLITNGSFLTRFDGKTFGSFKNPRAAVLAVAPDGDLWVGADYGLVRIPSSSFNQFTFSGLTEYQPGPGKASQIRSLRFSSNGVLWIGTVDGLFRYEGEKFVAVGPRVSTDRIEESPDGHLLVFNGDGFMELAGSEVVPHPGLAAQLEVKNNEIFDVLKDRRGNTWYCTGKGIVRQTNQGIEKLSPYNAKALRAHEDAHGTVWIAKEVGLFRATSAGLELVDKEMQARSFYSDRDGNLWIGTNGDGLYRFKDRAVRMFTKADGLPNDLIMTVIAAHDGSVWTGANCGGITRFDGKNFQTYSEKDGLLNSCVWSIAEDLNHDLWIGTFGGGAFRYHNGAFTQYSKSQGLVDDRVGHVYAARDGSVWFSTPGGVSRLRNGQLHNFTTADGLSANETATVFEDRGGTIWAGTRLGLNRLNGDRFENFPSTPNLVVIPFGEDRDGGFFINEQVGSESVTRRLYKDRVDTINKLSAYDVLETEQGELWFGGTPFARVQPGNFTHARPRDEPLDYEAFSTADGLTTAESTSWSRSLALTRDGKLYAATPKGLALFDLNRLRVTNTKPSIYLTDITIGRNTERASGEVVLPPGSNHVEIHFAAVEVSAPEKIHMQYRLDGVDSEWLDAPANPVAIFSNIPVGTHALRIRACNRNGIWDRQGTVFLVTQQPYFYQTRWFIAVMVALGVLLMALIYRLRVAQISRMLSVRFDERLAERTRVARELHDTLLQTVQGSKMVAEHALKNPADHTRMVRAMEQLSTWLAQATEEGRAALQSLRSSTTEKNSLAEAFRRAIDECGGSEKSFSVNGDSREMHPVVRDEIYRIGYEAIRNACAHSGAGKLEVMLEYAHDLTLRVSDNGIGIDSAVIEQGKEGHFGLRGMRERAERIGAKFTLVSSLNSGTVITLVVPGRIAFRT
ncbi:MAG TPA: two-component regulator propeller domain-containing protein [Pyrinomonadaceae bacterium]|nr:two-component regulator propeller domain-containing protein [Pyrinomonadaceae bacterium]